MGTTDVQVVPFARGTSRAASTWTVEIEIARPVRRRCPALPFSGTRMRAPSPTPAGMRTVIVSLRISTPRPAARAAGRLRQPPRSAARIAALRKHHAPAARTDDAGALAALASRLGDLQHARPRGTTWHVSRRVSVICRCDPRIASSKLERQPSRGDRRRAPARRVRASCRCAKTSAKRSPNVVASPCAARRREIESLELERDRARRARKRAGVVAQPPLRIAQRLVGSRDLLEAGLRRVVTRVDVRVILARKPLVGALDLDRASLRARMPSSSYRSIARL